jgi:hypothetical protein
MLAAIVGIVLFVVLVFPFVIRQYEEGERQDRNR